MPGVGGVSALENVTQQNRNPLLSPLTRQYNLYNTGVKQNAEDYSNIMQGYKNLLAQTNQAPGTYQPVTQSYIPSAATGEALRNLTELSQTGGYSDADKAALRERGVSPLRSIYQNAEREIDRNRVLQGGGTTVGYGALRAKMARELSDQIGGKMNDINATIAQNTAQNRLSAAPNLASAAQSQSSLENQVAQNNAASRNEAMQFNLQFPQQQRNLALQTLGGMQSLYGTTPALSNTFGNQALQGASLQNNINQNQNQQQLQLFNSALRALPYGR